MYPEQIVSPMRAELSSAGFQELRTANEVDQALSSIEGTTLVVINSVCGCAAGSARPGVKMAIEKATNKPTATPQTRSNTHTNTTHSHATNTPIQQPTHTNNTQSTHIHTHIHRYTTADISTHLAIEDKQASWLKIYLSKCSQQKRVDDAKKVCVCVCGVAQDQSVGACAIQTMAHVGCLQVMQQSCMRESFALVTCNVIHSRVRSAPSQCNRSSTDA